MLLRAVVLRIRSLPKHFDIDEIGYYPKYLNTVVSKCLACNWLCAPYAPQATDSAPVQHGHESSARNPNALFPGDVKSRAIPLRTPDAFPMQEPSRTKPPKCQEKTFREVTFPRRDGCKLTPEQKGSACSSLRSPVQEQPISSSLDGARARTT